MTIKVTYNITDVYVTQDVSPVYINVSYSSGGGSGAAVWGGITGTLSDQTDLQTALDGKFDDPTGTSSQYIDGTGALQTFPLTLPVLQEVRNQTGATLDAGTVVYINGATGNKPTVTKAIATGDATSAQTLGMVSAAIANNGTGYVVVIGTCSGLDTSAFTEGQQLYLSYTTAGAVTTTKPYAPYHLVYIGIVTRAHPTLGTVEVRVQNGYELDEIHDVDALNPNNNDGIFYNSTTSLWEHKQISTALGYTPANAATTLTINGVTYDLSTSRTWTISAGISGSGASGQVAYWDGTTSQAGSNNLFWDNANGRLGIGTNAPAVNVDILGSGTNGNAYLRVTRSNNTAGDAAFITQPQGTLSASNKSWNYGLIANSNTFRFWAYDGTTATTYLGIFNNGNVAIQNGGTFTDGGQRLQVQGTTLLNGNVTFSSSTGMTWDATNSRLGIGTNTPAYDLQVVKTTTTTYGGVYISARNNGATGAGGILAFNDQGEFGAIEMYGSNFATASIRRQTSFTGNGINGLNFIALNSSATANISFSTGTGVVEKMRLFNGGNLLLQNGGTFTDSGERLQVTGNVKITGQLNVTSSTQNNTYFNTNSTNCYVYYVPSSGTTWALGVQGQYLLGYAARDVIKIAATRTDTGQFIDTDYLGLGRTTASALLDLASSSTARASLRIRSGTAPTSPNDGDIWFDGTDIKMRIGGVTKTFTLV